MDKCSRNCRPSGGPLRENKEAQGDQVGSGRERSDNKIFENDRRSKERNVKYNLVGFINQVVDHTAFLQTVVQIYLLEQDYTSNSHFVASFQKTRGLDFLVTFRHIHSQS